MLYRENRDLAQQSTLTAMCMSSLAGNSDVDVSKFSEDIAELVEKVFYARFPYVKREEDESTTDEHQYDRYFKMLEEMDAEKKKAEDAQNTSKEKTQEDKSAII